MSPVDKEDKIEQNCNKELILCYQLNDLAQIKDK
jgi:hypothetical protein